MSWVEEVEESRKSCRGSFLLRNQTQKAGPDESFALVLRNLAQDLEVLIG